MGHHDSKGKLVERIVALLHGKPGFKIEQRVRIKPSRGGRGAEIDVLMTGNFNGYPVQFAFECKNEQKPIGIKHIRDFIDKLNDVGIPVQQGVFVSSSNLTSEAAGRARAAGVKVLMVGGLTENGLAQQIYRALQSVVYLMLHFREVTHECQVAPAVPAYVDGAGSFVGMFFDPLWLHWFNHMPAPTLGEQTIVARVPDGWHVTDGENIQRVETVTCRVEVTGHILQIRGDAKAAWLLDPDTKRAERGQVQAKFDEGLVGGATELVLVRSECELAKQIGSAGAYLTVTTRVKLPRIVIPWSSQFYWPPSKQTMITLWEIARARPDILESGDLGGIELEQTTINSFFEPVWDQHPFAGELNRFLDNKV